MSCSAEAPARRGISEPRHVPSLEARYAVKFMRRQSRGPLTAFVPLVGKLKQASNPAAGLKAAHGSPSPQPVPQFVSHARS